MTRLFVSLLFATAVSLATPGADDRACRPDPVTARGCKPLAPIDVTLTQAQSFGSRVDLDFSIRPLRDLTGLTWELQLPDDTFIMEGERAGVAAPQRDAVTTGRVVLSMPQDDAHRKVRLVAQGAFRGTDAEGNAFVEPIGVTSILSWGELPPPGPLVLTPDGETGELVSVVSLPTAHRMGR